MSANKIKHETRTIINLGSSMLSKNKIHKILREAKVQLKDLAGSVPVYIGNQITIGMYVVRLEFNISKIESSTTDKLSDYGKFNIRIFFNTKNGSSEIDLSKHSVFKDKYWSKKNLKDKITIKDLVQIIILCGQLERLKAFN